MRRTAGCVRSQLWNSAEYRGDSPGLREHPETLNSTKEPCNLHPDANSRILLVLKGPRRVPGHPEEGPQQPPKLDPQQGTGVLEFLMVGCIALRTKEVPVCNESRPRQHDPLDAVAQSGDLFTEKV